MTHYIITPFSKHILRTPLFPISLYLDLVDCYSIKKALDLLQIPLIRDALRLSSPELLIELDKWSTKDIHFSNQQDKKLEIAFLKYLARMTSRCTPFGLFAGCSLGERASNTNITLEASHKFKRVTQFDMQFWVALLKKIALRDDVMPYLKYYPNNSIYTIGDFYRYIEYKYIGTKREHSIVALRKSEILTTLVNHAKSGLNLEEMVLMLSENESERIEARQYIIKLIKLQFLISELDACVTGNNEWERVLMLIDKIPTLKKEHIFLTTIQKKLSDLDLNLVASPEKYSQIKKEIEKAYFPFNEKYLFQTDLNISTLDNSLGSNISKKVLQTLYFLNGIQPKKKSKNLENFKKAFYRRYESREVRLTTVMDTEIGIGYLQNQEMNDSHPILEYLAITFKKQRTITQKLTPYELILQKKIQESIRTKNNVLTLSEKDFSYFNTDLTDLPATFSVIIEMFGDNEIFVEPSEDVSATKLLGRFCNVDPAIYKLTKEIIEKEENYHSDKILAEIAHIPEARTGNILRRPILRKHEIAYLSNSGVSKNDAIDINDLWLSLSNDRIVLRSEKHDKEVLPCLSNAHNYTYNTLPIYHFLCDLQSQNNKPIHSFSWGILKSYYDFFPRVIYNDIILSKAQWVIKKEEIVSFTNKNKDRCFESFIKWKTNRNIYRYVQLVSSDNTLLFDLDTKIGMELFLNSVQGKAEILLEEFLAAKKTVVRNTSGDHFSNQVILSFFKEKKANEK